MICYNTFISDASQIPLVQSSSIREVILEHQELSRFGQLDTHHIKVLLQELLDANLFPVLQWDILLGNDDFQHSIKVLEQLPLSDFSAIRIRDLGAAEWLQGNYPQIPIHLIVETGNHNLIALKRWEEYWGPQLQRLVLSSELPGNTLKQYCSQLSLPCEILGVGRIVLLYTPRKLLTSLDFKPSSKFVECVATDDQTFPRHFPSIENAHGTFLFHDRDLFLLDLLEDLSDSELHMLRLDFRFISDFSWLKILSSGNKDAIMELMRQWPAKTTHGFYRANRTDRPIERLKNKHLRGHDENLVAHVAEAVKGEYLALISRKPFSCNDQLLFITPEGREIEANIFFIRDAKGESTHSADRPGLWLVPHYKYVTSQSLVYHTSPEE